MKVNRAQLSDILGCSLVTIDNHLREGMPFDEKPQGAGRGKGWILDSAACIKWIVKRAEDRARGDAEAPEGLLDARTRDRAAQASLRELELYKELGQLVTITDVIDRVEKDYTVVKQGLRAIPARMAQLLAVEEEPEAIEALLKTEVDSVLENLSNPNNFGKV